ADRRRAATPAAAPLHVGEAQLRQPERGGQPRRVVPVVAVRGEAVDLARVDPGVVRGAENGLERQLHLGSGRLAVLVVRRLADPDDRHLASERLSRHVGDYYTG